jgi:regulator of protease activity HflC (stomatin/prohibitin superfamily)
MTWLSQLFGFFRAFQIWIVIAPWEAALRIRLGKRVTVLSSGIHFRIPFLDRIFVQSVRLRTVSDSGQTITTKDGKMLTLAVAVSYEIDDIKKLYLTVNTPETTLLNQIQGVIAEFVAVRQSSEISPSTIEYHVTKKVKHCDWGLSSVKVMVTTYAFVKVYRLLNYEYRRTSSADKLEPDSGSPV